MQHNKCFLQQIQFITIPMSTVYKDQYFLSCRKALFWQNLFTIEYGSQVILDVLDVIFNT